MNKPLVNFLYKMPNDKTNKNHKKYCIHLAETGKFVCFGDNRYEDYTIHKDQKRKERYLVRHVKNESWDFSGRNTPGFFSRYLLWNKSNLKESIDDLNYRFGIEVIPANFELD